MGIFEGGDGEVMYAIYLDSKANSCQLEAFGLEVYLGNAV